MWIDELLSRPPIRRDGRNLIFETEGTAEWHERQAESVERYVDEHYEEDPHDGHQFGNFIATGLESRDAVVLDIGCGLFPHLPHYVAQLGLKRFVGLEPLTVAVSRVYPCLVGAIAENIPLRDGSVDAVLFATSLDHIDAEDAAIREVRRVLKPEGRIFFWQGLYEPEMIARQKSFEPIAGSWLRMIAGPLEYAVLFARMRKRKRQLETAADIDGVHFRYYTRKTFDASLARWGLTSVRELLPKGMPAVFVEAHTAAASEASVAPLQSLSVPTTVPLV